MTINNRFQNQPWYIKLWRTRHYIIVPFETLVNKIRSPKEPWGLLWSIVIGFAQSRMEYYYTWEEVKDRLRKR